MLIRLSVCAVACVCSAVLAASARAAEPTKDSLETVRKDVSEKKAVLVDVREKSEWDRGHVEGAILLPLSELRNGISREKLEKRLPAKRILYTHCAAGVRSCTAADILKKYDLEVRPLKPGYDDLIDAGFEKAED